MGREQEAMDLISLNATLTADTLLNRQTLAAFATQLLTEKNHATNSMLMEFATKQTRQRSWQSEVVIGAILQVQKGKQLKLSRKPSRYAQLFQERSGTVYEDAAELNELIWWPGRVEVAQYIPNRLTKLLRNSLAVGK